MVVLPHGNIVGKNPRTATVSADGYAAIVSVVDQIWVIWVYPQRVVVGVYLLEGGNGFKRLTAVVAHRNGLVDGIQSIFVRRITKYFVKIERTVAYFFGFFVDFFPFFTAVIGAVKGIFGRFYQGIHAVGPRARNGQAAASHRIGEVVGLAELLPSFASIVGHIQTRTLAARGKIPGSAAVLPHINNYFQGVSGIHDHLGYARFLVGKKYFLPIFAPVGGLENAPFRVVAERRANCTRINHVRVERVDQNTVDVKCFF